jgi:hypothetical protein
MCAEKLSGRLKLLTLLVLFTATAVSTVSAQTGRALDTVLVPGKTVWITDSAGREQQSRIVSLSGDVVTAAVGEEVRRLHAAEISQVRERRSDSVLNGALIGAGAAVATGLLLCRATEPWENCRDDVRPMLRIGALGAGIGIVIDWLIRDRQTTYAAAPGATTLRASPLLTGQTKGLRFSVSF